MRYQIDQSALELILAFEGYRDVVYPDSRGFATVGVGHLLHQSPPTPADHARWDHKPRSMYMELLRSDIERVAIEPMNRLLHVALNQHQVNAVASACFNCGAGFVAGSVGRKLNAGDYRGAADAFMLWSHPVELTARRRQERALFLTPVKQPFPWLTDAERRWCLELDRLKRTNRDLPRRRVLRRVIAGEAAKIQHAARYEGGWDRANRRQRFHSLIARCT